MVKWFRLILELLLALAGNNVSDSSSTGDVSERKRRREYEEWHKKYGSKWDRK